LLTYEHQRRGFEQDKNLIFAIWVYNDVALNPNSEGERSTDYSDFFLKATAWLIPCGKLQLKRINLRNLWIFNFSGKAFPTTD
jgi:hypothetical protein